MTRLSFFITVAALFLAFGIGAQARSAVRQERFPPADPESVGVSSAALEGLTREVESYLEKQVIVGAELLVIKNRRTVLHQTFGWADRESETPMVPNTLFNIRSMTKTLTGAAIQILIDEGEIHLDDPIALFLPGFESEASVEITIGQLLSHTGGIPLTAITEGLDQYEDLEELANAVGERGPRFTPGSKFWYSDAGTDVLGAVVEVVSEQKLDEFVRERLLEPLGMDDTLTATETDDPRWSRIASLYIGGPGSWQRFWKNADGAFYPFAWGSQSLYSTTKDYARFLALWMDRGMVGDRRVLSEEAVARTLAPRNRVTSMGSDELMPTGFMDLQPYYGQMAIVYAPQGATEDTEPVILGHGGSDGTIAWAWPREDLIICYFTQSRGGLSALRLETAIDRFMFHEGEEVEHPPEWDDFLGMYTANFGSFFSEPLEILVVNGSLALDVPSQLVYVLDGPEQDGTWRARSHPGLSFQFERDEDGDVVGLRMGPYLAPRGVVPARTLSAEEADRYVGRYSDEQRTGVIEVKFDDGALVFHAPNLPEPVPAEGPNDQGFLRLARIPGMLIRFNDNSDGTVRSYTVYSEAGEFERFKLDAEDPGATKDAAREGGAR